MTSLRPLRPNQILPALLEMQAIQCRSTRQLSALVGLSLPYVARLLRIAEKLHPELLKEWLAQAPDKSFPVVYVERVAMRDVLRQRRVWNLISYLRKDRS
jgi:hypothetical protein